APPGFPWLLRIVNSGPVPVRIDVTITAVRAPAPSTLGWANDIDLVGGATLGGIGALSLFLGLFLQGGVYRSSRPPPAPESPSAPGPPGH
ncbi:MAG TPA: hypothetical protein VMH90_02535, partial [Thermoplasmata archaeon]|nr:hypothetical protein [Thermoplasmata archaeon]